MNNQQFLQELDKVNQKFKEIYTSHMLKVYHQLIHDDLTLDTIEELCDNIGVDIKEEYYDIMSQLEDEQEND